MPSANRKLCDACLPAHAERASQAAAQARLRYAIGERDARSSDEARAKHRAASIRQGKRQRAWKAAHPVTPDPQQFTAEIWPHIRNRSVHELMAASGLSRPLCRNILRGKAVPHPMHWDAFRKLMRKRAKFTSRSTP